jgi:cell division protein FtsN
VERAPVVVPQVLPALPLIPAWALGKFSIPMILDLERGKYYVQVGAYSRHDTLNNAAGRIDKVYPLKVQISGSETKPLYRLVIGPLNQGEAQAHLQRFKKTGYDDAFVRSEF